MTWREKGFETIVWVQPAYDRLSEGCGIGACRIIFILKGPLGAVQFMIGTEWYVPSAREHLLQFAHTSERCLEMKPTGWDVGYHSPKPMYESHSPISGSCELVEGGQCYYDGSGLMADEWVDDFVAGGTKWLWPKLREQYAFWFEGEQEKESA